MGNVLRRIFPFLSWIDEYKSATLRADFMAGLTVALVLIPQSMAYAQLAGLPAYYGLYAAFLPPMIASLFGSSRQLATGPVAVVSLMTSAALEPIATAGSGEYITYAILLALSVGLFQLLLGLLRLGLVVNLLSHPVVNGFTCAAALIIATSQLPKIFGVYVDKAEHHYETVFRVISAAVHYTHWPTLGMAVLAFGIMIVLKKVNPKIPNVLAAVLVTTVLSAQLGFRHDEEIALDRIHPEEVRNEILRFNTTAKTLEETESLRTKANMSMALLTSSTPKDAPAFCGQCHTPRDIAAFGNRSASEIAARSDQVVTIHLMAGLVSSYIEVLKEQASEIRAELRGHHFERVLDTDGRPSFYLRGQVPKELTGDGARWRIKIGSWCLDPEKISVTGGGAVVGVIPKGLPEIKLPDVRNNLSLMLKLIPTTIIISLLGFMEAISIAKAMAAKTRQKLDPNQELIGQGLANIVGCCGQSYACSGSFSRSAVNLQAGARTGMSNVFSSAFVVVVLLFLTQLLFHLPQAVLAAIIMMAVVGLLNVSGFVHAWRVRKFDGITGVVSFAGTLIFAPHLEWGILIGIVLAIGGYLIRSMRPKVARLAPHPDGSLRDARRHQLRQCRHLAIIRFDGPLNFASVSYLEDEILGEVADMPDLKHILVDADGISEIDASGEEMLRHLIQQLRGGGYSISFSALGDDIVDAIKRAHLYEFIGENHVFSTQAQAVAAIYAMAHASSPEADCPLRSLMPRVTEVSLHPDGSLRDAQRHNLPACEKIAVLRFDDPLNFANTNFLEEEILKLASRRAKVRHLIFAAQGVADLRDDGAEKLGELVAWLRNQGYDVAFSSFGDNVLDVLDRTGVAEVIGQDNIYPAQGLAIAGVYRKAHENSTEQDCPLTPLIPHVAHLSLHPDGTLRDARRHGLELCRHIAAIRFDGPLNFVTIGFFKDELLDRLNEQGDLNHVLIAAHGINAIGVRAAEELRLLVERLRREGYGVSFSGLQDKVLDVLDRTGVAEVIGEDNMYPDRGLAVAGIYRKAHANSTEQNCPLAPLIPHVAHLSLHPDGTLRDARRHGLELCRHIAVIRFDGPLNFVTFGFFKDELLERLYDQSELNHVLIAAHGINAIGERAAEELRRLVERLRQDGYEVSFSGLQDKVLDVLDRTGIVEKIGEGHLYPSQPLAIAGIYRKSHADSTEERCPLAPLLPHITALSLHPDGSLRDARRNGLELCRHIAAIRFDGPLNYVTIGHLEDELLGRLKDRAEMNHVLIAAHGINAIDARAAEKLGLLVKDLRRAGYEVSFSGLKDNVLDVLHQTGVYAIIREERIYPTQAVAVAAIYTECHKGSSEKKCPLIEVVRSDSPGRPS